MRLQQENPTGKWIFGLRNCLFSIRNPGFFSFFQIFELKTVVLEAKIVKFYVSRSKLCGKKVFSSHNSDSIQEKHGNFDFFNESDQILRFGEKQPEIARFPTRNSRNPSFPRKNPSRNSPGWLWRASDSEPESHRNTAA